MNSLSFPGRIINSAHNVWQGWLKKFLINLTAQLMLDNIEVNISPEYWYQFISCVMSDVDMLVRMADAANVLCQEYGAK